MRTLFAPRLFGGPLIKRGTLFMLIPAFICGCGGDPLPMRSDAIPDATRRHPDAGLITDATMVDAPPIAMDAMVSPPDASLIEAGPGPDAAGILFDQSLFMATHNSYSGEERGTILAQLERGVRFLEFDIHDNDFSRLNDYQIGHDSPGDEVARGSGNPSDVRLRPWLEVIRSWSRTHPGHAPITIAIDAKDDLTDNTSFGAGGLAHLADIFLDIFRTQLYPAHALSGIWPSVDSLRGRVLVVLSGHQETRELYLRDRGADPSVATDVSGRVVVTHHSGSGTLWYWTGQHRADGHITWHRHGRYDTGTTPAVALRNDGVIVEVHRSESRSRLFYRVGQMDADYEVRWGPSRDYDDGETPTLSLLADGRVHERHRSPSGDRVWEWYGTINADELRIDWRGNARVSGGLFIASEATSARGRIEVLAGADGSGGADTLLYTTPTARRQRIRYEQVLFVERQPGDLSVLAVDPLRFFASSAGNRSAITEARGAGLLVRAWGFNRVSLSTVPPSNFPATDTPHAPWYLEYMRTIGAVEF